MISIDYNMIVFKPELDLSSCGNSVEHAKEMLKTAARLFVEEAKKMGTLFSLLK